MSIPDLVIRELRVRPVVAPLPRPIRTASGDVLDAPLLLIDVLTDAGVAGRAMRSPIRRSPRVRSRGSCATSPLNSSENPSALARMRQMEKRLKPVGWQGFAGMVVGTLVAHRSAFTTD